MTFEKKLEILELLKSAFKKHYEKKHIECEPGMGVSIDEFDDGVNYRLFDNLFNMLGIEEAPQFIYESERVPDEEQEAFVGIWKEPWKIRATEVIVVRKSYAQQVRDLLKKAEVDYTQNIEFYDCLTDWGIIEILRLELYRHQIPIVKFIDFDSTDFYVFNLWGTTELHYLIERTRKDKPEAIVGIIAKLIDEDYYEISGACVYILSPRTKNPKKERLKKVTKSNLFAFIMELNGINMEHTISSHRTSVFYD